MIVPSIAINGEVQQDSTTYQWLKPPIGADNRDGAGSSVVSSSHDESELSADGSVGGAKLLSSGYSRTSAPSLSGDLSDGSILSDSSDY